MDHARHLSSPSPTSPFLFHHSERSFKSNPLTPLLSSTVVPDVTSVDECFSTSSSSSNNLSQQNHNPFGLDNHDDHHSHENHNNHHPSNHHSLIDNHHHSQHTDSNHHSQSHHQRHNQRHDPCVIDQDSLTGVEDDDDGMHNMLSGSSSSSNSTMPLLTESHTHHSFSRISLEGYSPLSLVEDCDNALPISPTSLACGSHHPFKSSLNGLKMDNLVGDVDPDNEVDVNDARSLSPTLLSSSSSNAANNHHNLWSNSSTAITQNTSILTSSSTSFLLSHHQQQQLNSLMQQLEPQSLDETPPLVGNNSNSATMTGVYGMNDSLALSRPSSEPPAGVSNCSKVPGADAKSVIDQSSKKQAGAAISNNHTGSSIADATPLASNHLCASNSGNSAKRRRIRARVSKSVNIAREDSAKSRNSDGITKRVSDDQQGASLESPVISSKVHLQMNHHKKLQELQRRLFGTGVPDTPTSGSNKTSDEQMAKKCSESCSGANSTQFTDPVLQSEKIQLKEEPDSSGNITKEKEIASSTTTASPITPTTTISSAKQENLTIETRNSNSLAKTRPVRNRKVRGDKATSAESCKPSSSTGGAQKMSLSGPSSNKGLTSETAEPDTTTKPSECIRLADLLAMSPESKVLGVGSNHLNNSLGGGTSNNAIKSFTILNGFTNQASACDHELDEKRIQQIQLQVSPTLTVVTNGNLVQQVTGCGTSLPTNQILCRSQSKKAAGSTNGKLKAVVSANELLKTGDNLVSTWSLQPRNTSGSNSNATNISGQTIAIQVICQDGTSLVLPVSSSGGLNAAVSLNTQHQQLQAVLAHGTNGAGAPGSQQRSQIIPLVSVSNMVSQQQGASNNEHSTGQANGGSVPSGLAASSPTLAALLDAGPSRHQIECNGSGGQQIGLSGGNFVTTNLLRKLVSSAGQASNPADTSFRDSSSCSTMMMSGGAGNKSTVVEQLSSAIDGTGEVTKKCIKLENVGGPEFNGVQATLQVIDPQVSIRVKDSNQTIGLIANSALQQQQRDQQTGRAASSEVTTLTFSSKSNKTTTSTGNRQVDPTQPFRCEHCNSTFTRLGNFTRHKKIHTVPSKDGQRFKCDVCSKSFLQRCDLARHLHIHRGTEPHRCNICGKGYIRHSDLVTHQRFHNKEKPFGCPHCSKGFCQRGDLNRHLRSIHLQMKPILCPCCNRKFAKQETLLRHLNTAHRNKAGTTTGSGIVSTERSANEAPSNTSLGQGDQNRQATVTVVTNGLGLSTDSLGNRNGKKSETTSLQAIQASLGENGAQVQQTQASSCPDGVKMETELVASSE